LADVKALFLCILLSDLVACLKQAGTNIDHSVVRLC